MSKNEAADMHEVGPTIHPAVSMAVQIAATVYSNRAGPVIAEQFEQIFDEMAVKGHRAKLNVHMRTAALMLATALQFGASFEQNAGLLPATSASDPAAAEGSRRANRAMEAVASLSTLADRYGGAPAA